MQRSRRWEPSKWVDYGTTEKNYSWTQTPDDVTISIVLPDKNLHSRDIEVSFTCRHLRVALRSKPAEPLIDGDLTKMISVDDSTWTLDNGLLEVTLAKGVDSAGDDEGKWWPSAIVGDKEVDVKAIESTRFLDDSLLRRIYEDKHKAQAENPLAAASAAADETDM